MFHRFITFFKQQAAALIERGVWPLQELLEHETKNLRLFATDLSLSEQEKQAFMEATNCQRFYLSGRYRGVYLTAKEQLVMTWVARGKSTEEAAVITQSSVRTVEKHLAVVKYKLGTNRTWHAIRILVEQKVLEISEEFGC